MSNTWVIRKLKVILSASVHLKVVGIFFYFFQTPSIWLYYTFFICESLAQVEQTLFLMLAIVLQADV